MTLRSFTLLIVAVWAFGAGWFALLAHTPVSLSDPNLDSVTLAFEEVDISLADELGAKLLYSHIRADGVLLRRYAIPNRLSPRAVERAAVSALNDAGLSAIPGHAEKQGRVSLSVGFAEEQVAEVSFVPTPGLVKGLIALVIDDFGYRLGRTENDFLGLSFKIAAAVIPGHTYSMAVAERAAEVGMEVLIHLPMEPERYTGGEDDHILLISHRDDEIRRRVRASLAAIPEARGLNNHMGSKATGDVRVMRILMEELGRAGMYFLDSATSSTSVAAASAKKDGLPYARRAVFLDNPGDERSIRDRLAELKRVAGRQGAAIGIGHPYRATLAALQHEIPRLVDEGFRLVFPSEIVR